MAIPRQHAGPQDARAGTTVLLVEDDPNLGATLAELLTAHGYIVVTKPDGQAAIDALGEREFDIVLCDICLPGRSGLEVLAACKDLWRETEVVVMTGRTDLDTAIECLRNGAFDYLKKPFTSNEILVAVQRAVEHRELNVEKLLDAASRAILDVCEPQRLLETIIAVTRAVMKADDVSLMLPGERGQLYIAHSHALTNEVMSETRLPIGDRIAGRVAALGKPVLLSSKLADDPRFADIATYGRVQSSIVYPLVAAGERLVGVLSISRVAKDRPFRNRDLKIATVLASQVLLALENARLLRDLVQSERLASVGQLAASVAHEINNPVSYVLASQGYLEEQLDRVSALASRPSSRVDPGFSVELGSMLAELRQASAEIREGALRVRDIAREIGSLARVDDAASLSFDVNEAIRAALRIAGTQLQHARVIEHLGDDLVTSGNPGRISQVFVNLLVNAGQALDKPNHDQITVSSLRSGDQIHIHVADNGCGIPREHLARVFESFFTTKGSTSGTGLGLAISREIVRSFGGDLRVESTPGQGSTFTVVLPRIERVAPSERPESPRIPTGEVPRPMRLLFIEDEPFIRRGYVRAFGKADDIVVVGDGEEAWQVLTERQHFDMIICDLMMPRVSGIELFGRVCATYPELAEKFLFVTGGATDADAQAFLASNQRRVLSKPFEMGELVALVGANRPRPR